MGLVAVDAHSRRRLEAIVRQCSPAAARGALLDDPHAVARLVDATDLVLATNAARLPEPLLRRVRRLLRIGWTMEGGRPRSGHDRRLGAPGRAGPRQADPALQPGRGADLLLPAREPRRVGPAGGPRLPPVAAARPRPRAGGAAGQRPARRARPAGRPRGGVRAIQRWRDRPSPCARYDDPGLFEHRGLACTWRADCTVVRSGGAWRWGDTEREAHVEVHNRLGALLAQSIQRWRDRYAAVLGYVAPGSPTAPSLATPPSGAPPGCRPAADAAAGCCACAASAT